MLFFTTSILQIVLLWARTKEITMNTKQRIIQKFLVSFGKYPLWALEILQQEYSRTHVFEWFKRENKEVNDDSMTERPSTRRTHVNVERVKQVVWCETIVGWLSEWWQTIWTCKRTVFGRRSLKVWAFRCRRQNRIKTAEWSEGALHVGVSGYRASSNWIRFPSAVVLSLFSIQNGLFQ